MDGQPPAKTGLLSETWHGYTVERLALPASDGTEIPALFINPGCGGRSACVLALHGMTGNKENWLAIENFPKGGGVSLELLDRGIALFCLDLPDHGERSRSGETGEELSARIKGPYYPDFVRESRRDLKTVLSYLRARPDIDPERIGVIGYSLGGILAFHAARAHHLKAAVVCVPPIRILGHPPSSLDDLPGLSLPFLMLMGKKDDLYTEEEVRQIFDMLPMERKDLIFYDSGHGLPAEYKHEAAAWFGKYLG